MSPPRRRRPSDDEPLLFDLPLGPPGAEERSVSGRAAKPEQTDLFAVSPESDDDAGPGEEAGILRQHGVEPTSETPVGSVVAGIGPRLLAGFADAMLHVGVLAGVYLGLIGLGVEPRLGYWPAIVTLLAAFSFLSSVVSLAFWGQTAGMAWRGLQTRDRLQQPLTFRQAVLRWAGGLLTCAAAGLPLLLAPGGTSLSDWMSRSITYSLGSASRRSP